MSAPKNRLPRIVALAPEQLNALRHVIEHCVGPRCSCGAMRETYLSGKHARDCAGLEFHQNWQFARETLERIK